MLADLQSGLTLTFLQHGRVRELAKEPSTVSYDPEGEGVPGVIVQYRKCSWFKHQDWLGGISSTSRPPRHRDAESRWADQSGDGGSPCGVHGRHGR